MPAPKSPPSSSFPSHTRSSAAVSVPQRAAPPLDHALIERSPGETRVALLAAGQLWEVHHLRDQDLQGGDILLGRVRAKGPGGTAAFVDIGDQRDGFLALEDCAPRAEDGSPAPLPPIGAAVLVEVAIPPRAEKGAKLTMALSLAPQGSPDGAAMVYTPLRPGVGLSAKITHKAERQRLRAWAEAAVGAGEGLVLRTRAWDIDEDRLDRALDAARREWKALQGWAQTAKPPCRLRAALDSQGGPLGVALGGRTVARVICSGPGAVEAARAGRPDLADRIVAARSKGSLFAVEGIDEEIEAALTPRLGPLTIEQTAAVTAIDVDSGASGIEETNVAMVMEIARQIRLRNLAGMIVIDFAAPRRGVEGHKRALAEALATALADDPAKAQVLGVSRLGLVEVRRPRQGAPLRDSLCGAAGASLRAEGLSAVSQGLAALRMVTSTVSLSPGMLPELQVSSAVFEALQGPLRTALTDAEQRLGDRLPLDPKAEKPASWWSMKDRRA